MCRICCCEDNLPRYTGFSVNCERQKGLSLQHRAWLEGQEACACMCTLVDRTGHLAG